MSTTVDQRVVQMQFDNKHFESNVSTTMSTLDKLKQKLRFDGATKGLSDVSNAAGKVNMSGLGAGVEAVSAKFSAMQVVGVTALANITNSAINTGKRMIKALTLDPVTTGFKEYETQINAVQTILANTKHKGSTIDDVNAALDELNKYADMTIYNFTEMTRNIGTFTAAGVDLETSVGAIQGIANLAAVSGSTSQQASTAMYQLSLALSSGTVKLQDWNSVVNAGMGGEVFQNALKKTSEELQTGAEAAIKATGSFRESLREGWLTAEVLTETLKKFTTSGANEYLAEYTGLMQEDIELAIKEGEAAEEAAKAEGKKVDAIDAAAEALAKKSGKNKQEIYDVLDMARTATEAATEVKTFTQLWDVLKESAQSGWSQTWKLIVGDFEEAKELLSPLADTLTGFINKMSDARNRILQVALDFTKPWTAITEKLGNVKKAIAPIEKVIGTLENFQDIVDRVWLGEFSVKGGTPDRRDLLKAAGYDPRVVQELVNLGEQSWQAGKRYKLSAEEVEAAHAKFGLTMKTTKEETEEATAAFESFTDEQLKNAGLTKEEISLYRALESEADRLGISVSDLADEMSNTNGRDLLIDSFKNIGDVFVGTGKAIGEAWKQIFNPPSLEVLGVRLYGIIRSIKDFTESLRLTDKETGKLNENGAKLVRTFKGIFAVLDIVMTVVGGPLKIVFKLITQLLGAFGFNILDVTAVIGDMLVKLRDFIDGALDFSGVFAAIATPIKNAYAAFKQWIDSLKESEDLPRDIAVGIATAFGKAVKAIATFFKTIPKLFKNGFSSLKESPIQGIVDKIRGSLGIVGEVIGHLGNIIREKINKFLSRSEFAGISGDSIAGLVEGFKGGAGKAWSTLVEIFSNIVQKVKDFLGIHSPSTVFMAIGGFIIAGLVAGLQNGIPDSLGAVKDVLQPILDWLKGIDFGAILAAVFGIGTAATGYKAVDTLSKLASPIEGLGDVFSGVGEVLTKSAKPIAKVVKSTSKVVKSFSKVLKGFANTLNGVAFNMKADAIMTLGKTLLMLVAAIVVLTWIKPAKLWNAVGIITALALVLVGLAFAMDKMSSASISMNKGLNIDGLKTGLIGIGIAILLLGITVKMIGSLNPEQAKQGFLGLLGLVGAILAVVSIFGLLVKGKSAQNTDKFGKMMTKMAVALLLMTMVVKMLGGLDRTTLIQGGVAIVAFAGIMVGLMAATKLLGDNRSVGKIGGTLLKISAAIGVMALVAKMLGSMSLPELIQGGLAIVAFGGIIVGLMAATRLLSGRENKNIDKMGGTLLKIALAIGVMALVAKMLGNMKQEELIQGGLAIVAFSGIIVGLMAATKLISGSKNIEKIGGALFAISGAIAIMALTAFMLSMISWEGFAKGTIMITAFAGIIVGLMAATRLLTGSKNVEKIGATLISIAAAIGILALIAVLLGLVPTEKLAKGVIAVTILSAVMAGLIAVTKLAKGCIGNIITITVAVAVVAAAIYLLSTVDPTALAGATAAMGALLVIFGLLIAVTSVAKNAWQTLALLIGLVVGVGAVLYILAGLPVDSVLGVATGLSTVLLALSAACLIVSFIPVAAAAQGALGLAAFIGIMAGVLLILGGLSKIPGFNELIADGGTTLSLIGRALGAFVGSIVAGFAGEVLTILPALGAALSGFMIGATPFIAGAKMVDESVLTGVGILSAAILALTVADLIAGVSSFLQGGSSFADLGTQLSQFMINALPFIMTAAMITPEMLSGVKALAETILIITAADILQGLTSFLTGGSSLENFAAQLPILGQGLAAFSASLGEFTPDQLATVNTAAQAIKTLAQASSEIPNSGGLLAQIVGENDLGAFAAQFPILGAGLRMFLDTVGTFSEDQVATVNCAAQAIKSLAQASSEIPNSGGWLGQIVGENDLGTFAEQFPVLGTGLRGFLDNVGTFTEEQVATVDCAASAIKSLATAASEIPNSGGWVGAIVGNNDLGTFAEQFPSLGTGLAGFLTNVGTFTDDQVSTVNCAANAVKTLASVASTIPNEGGWISKIVGDNSLGTFADNFPKLGKGLKGFVDELGTFTDGQVSTVSSAIRAIKALSGLANADLAGAKKNISGFGDKLPDFGEDLKSFCSKMPSAESVTTACSNINKILSAVRSIANANTGVLATFADNLKEVGTSAVKKFTGAFTSDAAKSDLKKAAMTLAGKAVEGAKSKYDAMKGAGKYLVEGFGKGIDDKTWYAEARAKAMANAAEKAAKKALDVNSPSKVFRAIGYSVPEGFAMGIDKMSGMAINSSTNMADDTIKNVSRSIVRISDMMSADIDSQPTIRPVLDLSDVEAGASTIGSMFTGSTLGVNANLGSISSMMNSRSQNGANDDVVSELYKLRKDIGSMERNSYNINGINVSEGTDAADAIKTLVRVIQMEGRS